MSGTRLHNEFLYGKSEPVVVTENGYKFRIDWTTGQKTGFFIDQSDNRKLLESYTRWQRCPEYVWIYRRFLCICHEKCLFRFILLTVHSLPLSWLVENINLNFGDDNRHEAFQVDAFDYLNNIKDKYDLIVLDPPAFAKHNNVLANALQGYKRLNIKAIEQIRPGGIIFTFSCSQVVSKENFRKSVFAAAANTGRNVRILHQMSQPPDHPVNIYHPESEYLKGLGYLC